MTRRRNSRFSAWIASSEIWRNHPEKCFAVTRSWADENPGLLAGMMEALMQAAMHSHYHRGQNATRLRELGGAPPGTDFIEWLRQGQPAAQWE